MCVLICFLLISIELSQLPTKKCHNCVVIFYFGSFFTVKHLTITITDNLRQSCTFFNYHLFFPSTKKLDYTEKKRQAAAAIIREYHWFLWEIKIELGSSYKKSPSASELKKESRISFDSQTLLSYF